jgi:hypothetical protein
MRGSDESEPLLQPRADAFLAGQPAGAEQGVECAPDSRQFHAAVLTGKPKTTVLQPVDRRVGQTSINVAKGAAYWLVHVF